MRFGIMEIQLEALIPPDASTEQIAAQLTNFDHSRLVQNVITHGFKLVELNGDLPMFFAGAYSSQSIERLAALKREHGLSYTIHLPLWSVEPSTPLESVRRGSVQAIVDNILASRALQPEVYVMHATGSLAAEFYRMRGPEKARALILRQFQNSARQSLKEILTQTGLPSRQIAIETVEFPFELTLELAEEFDLSLCLDTGHILVGFSGKIELFEALEKCLPRLAEIHLHDGPWQGPQGKIGYGQDHQSLGKGDLDVGQLLQRLDKAHFSAPIIFELSCQEALQSMDVIRAYNPELTI